MQAAVKRHGAHIGIALDGDADRVIIADEHGDDRRRRQHHGDVRAPHDRARASSSTSTLVTTVMSNLGLERALQSARRTRRAHAGRRSLRRRGDAQQRLQLRRRAVGPPRVPRPHDHRRRRRSAALQVLAVMLESGKPLSELRRVMTRYPQVLVNLKVNEKKPLDELPAVSALIAKVEQELGDRRARARALLGHRGQGARDDRGARRGRHPGLRRRDRPRHRAGVRRRLGVRWTNRQEIDKA